MTPPRIGIRAASGHCIPENCKKVELHPTLLETNHLFLKDLFLSGQVLYESLSADFKPLGFQSYSFLGISVSGKEKASPGRTSDPSPATPDSESVIVAMERVSVLFDR